MNFVQNCKVQSRNSYSLYSTFKRCGKDHYLYPDKPLTTTFFWFIKFQDQPVGSMTVTATDGVYLSVVVVVFACLPSCTLPSLYCPNKKYESINCIQIYTKGRTLAYIFYLVSFLHFSFLQNMQIYTKYKILQINLESNSIQQNNSI